MAQDEIIVNGDGGSFKSYAVTILSIGVVGLAIAMGVGLVQLFSSAEVQAGVASLLRYCGYAALALAGAVVATVLTRGVAHIVDAATRRMAARGVVERGGRVGVDEIDVLPPAEALGVIRQIRNDRLKALRLELQAARMSGQEWRSLELHDEIQQWKRARPAELAELLQLPGEG